MRDSSRMDPDDDAVARAAWRPPAVESERSNQGARPVADDTTSRATASLLVMRRSVAFIAELAVLNLLVLPVLWALVGDRFEFALGDVELVGNVEIDAAHGVAVIVFLLVRDLPFGSSALTKKLLGLRVVHASDGDASALQRVARNVTLLLTPLFWLVELSTARSAGDGRRYGDRIASTKVVDMKP